MVKEKIDGSKAESKQIGINLIANIMNYGISVLIAFCLTPYLISNLGKEAYSFYPMSSNFVSCMTLVTIALNSMAARYISIEIIGKRYQKANEYFTSVLFANLILAVILAIPMVIIVKMLEVIINIPLGMEVTVKILFSTIFISMLVSTVTSVFGVAVIAANRVDLRSYSEIFQGIIRIILYVGLFTLLKPDIIYIGIVYLIVALVNMILHMIYTRRLLPQIKIKINYFNWAIVKTLLSSGIWNSIQQAGMLLLSGMTITICNIVWGAAEGGNYSIMMTIPNFITGLISALAAVFLPIFIKKYAENDIHGMVNETVKAQKLMGIFINIPIGVFAAIGIRFFQLWVPGEDFNKLQLMSLMALFPLIFMGVTWPITNLNVVLNRVKMPALYLVFSGTLNLVLIALIARFTSAGIYSVVLAYMIVHCLWLGIFVPIYPCILLKLKWYTFYKMIVKNFISIVFCYVCAAVLNRYIFGGWIGLILICAICGVTGIVFNFFFVYTKQERKAFYSLLDRKR